MEITFSSQKSLDTNPIFERFVQGENLAEKIEIKGPKMLGALDLSQLNMAIRVSSEKYETTVEKPMQQKTEDDQVILTWTVDKDFTAVPGHVNVSVIGYGSGQDEEIIKITSDGIEVKPDDLQGTPPPENQWPQILREMQGYANSAQANADKAEAAAARAEAVPTDLQHFVDDAAAAAKNAEKSAEEAAASAASVDASKLVNITGGAEGQIPVITGSGYQWTNFSAAKALQNLIAPIGYIFPWAPVDGGPDLSTAQKVAEYYGFGTWAEYGKGRVMVGLDTGQTEFNEPGQTGGEKDHSLTIPEGPKHAHGVKWQHEGGLGTGNGVLVKDANSGGPWPYTYFTEFSGEGRPHNNLQPYIVVYYWQRIA